MTEATATKEREKKPASLASIRLDLDAEVKGTWTTIYGMAFLLARLRNPNHEDAMRRIALERREARDFDTEDLLGLQLQISREAMPGTVILDFGRPGEEVRDEEDGEPIPYSVETCREIIADERNRLLVEAIEQFAGRTKNYLERVVGNSRPSPDSSDPA